MGAPEGAGPSGRPPSSPPCGNQLRTLQVAAGVPKSTRCPRAAPGCCPISRTPAADGAGPGLSGHSQRGWRNEVQLDKGSGPPSAQSVPSATSTRPQPAPRWVPVTLAGSWQPGGSGCRGLGRGPRRLRQLPPLPLTWLRPHAPGMLAQVRRPGLPFLRSSLPPAGGEVWREARPALSHRHSGSPTRTAAPPWAGGTWVSPLSPSPPSQARPRAPPASRRAGQERGGPLGAGVEPGLTRSRSEPPFLCPSVRLSVRPSVRRSSEARPLGSDLGVSTSPVPAGKLIKLAVLPFLLPTPWAGAFLTR